MMPLLTSSMWAGEEPIHVRGRVDPNGDLWPIDLYISRQGTGHDFAIHLSIENAQRIVSELGRLVTEAAALADFQQEAANARADAERKGEV